MVAFVALGGGFSGSDDVAGSGSHSRRSGTLWRRRIRFTVLDGTPSSGADPVLAAAVLESGGHHERSGGRYGEIGKTAISTTHRRSSLSHRPNVTNIMAEYI